MDGVLVVTNEPGVFICGEELVGFSTDASVSMSSRTLAAFGRDRFPLEFGFLSRAHDALPLGLFDLPVGLPGLTPAMNRYSAAIFLNLPFCQLRALASCRAVAMISQRYVPKLWFPGWGPSLNTLIHGGSAPTATPGAGLPVRAGVSWLLNRSGVAE